MPEFLLSLATVNQTPLDLEGNAGRILDCARKISGCLEGPGRSPSRLPHIVSFPELSLTGYGCEDGFYMPHLIEGAARTLEVLARDLGRILPGAVVFLGLPFREESLLYNCQAALQDGRLLALIPKTHLAGEGLHYEPRWFRGWQGQARKDLKSRSSFFDGVPMGPLVLDCAGVRVGVEICEDSWVSRRPALDYFQRSVDLILNPSASHFGLGKHAIRRSIVEASSREYSCYYASVNLLGNEAGRSIYDGSRLLAAGGRLLHDGPRMSFRDGVVSIFELPLDGLRNERNRLFSRKEILEGEPSTIIVAGEAGRAQRAGFAVEPESRSARSARIAVTLEKGNGPIPYDGLPDSSALFSEFLDCECLALFDYMRKTASSGYTVSLSGGADSAACALLVQRMIARGVAELGPETFLEKSGLSRMAADWPVGSTSESAMPHLTRRLLHTLYQGTPQNSAITRDAARAVAEALGSDHHEIDVGGLVDHSRQLIEGIIQRPLSWEGDDLTLQNIQARVRSPLVWMLANATGSILIATGNRSEASTGYCTMDGDTSGGLAPIAGIDKAFLLRWLQFMEVQGDDVAGPVPALTHINRQQPTAELRPLDTKQTDEKDLMPYPLLALIERCAFENLLGPDEISAHLLAAKKSARRDGDYSILEHLEEEAILAQVQRFFILWQRSQWKRERFAVSFHIDSYNLDPRSWLRFPVLSAPMKCSEHKPGDVSP